MVPPGNTARENNLQRGALNATTELLCFMPQQALGRRMDAQPGGAMKQPLHVPVPQKRITIHHRHGFEQAIAVLKPAVVNRNVFT